MGNKGEQKTGTGTGNEEKGRGRREKDLSTVTVRYNTQLKKEEGNRKQIWRGGGEEQEGRNVAQRSSLGRYYTSRLFRLRYMAD